MTRERIVAEARRWIGTPYHHRARVLGAGCDCLMLIVEAFTVAGLLPADLVVPDYSHDMMFHSADSSYLDAVLAYCDEVEQPRPGDVVLWQFGKTWSHGGIVADWPAVIHAYAPIGQVIEMSVADDQRLQRRTPRFFTPRGIA